MSHYSGYMRRAFSDREGIVREAHEQLGNLEFDTFVGCGISGSLIAPLLADASNGKRNFAIVRKQVSSHAEYQIEGDIGRRWVFVDDFIATGDTFKYVMERVQESASDFSWNQELIGAYLYQNRKFVTVDFLRDMYPSAFRIKPPVPNFQYRNAFDF